MKQLMKSAVIAGAGVIAASAAAAPENGAFLAPRTHFVEGVMLSVSRGGQQSLSWPWAWQWYSEFEVFWRDSQGVRHRLTVFHTHWEVEGPQNSALNYVIKVYHPSTLQSAAAEWHHVGSMEKNKRSRLLDDASSTNPRPTSTSKLWPVVGSASEVQKCEPHGEQVGRMETKDGTPHPQVATAARLLGNDMHVEPTELLHSGVSQEQADIPRLSRDELRSKIYNAILWNPALKKMGKDQWYRQWELYTSWWSRLDFESKCIQSIKEKHRITRDPSKEEIYAWFWQLAEEKNSIGLFKYYWSQTY